MVVGFWVQIRLALYRLSFCIWRQFVYRNTIRWFMSLTCSNQLSVTPTQSTRFCSHGDNRWLRGLYADNASPSCVGNFQQYHCDSSSRKLHVHIMPRMLPVLSAISSRVSVFRIVTQTRLDVRGIVGSISGTRKKYDVFFYSPWVHVGPGPTLPAFHEDRNSPRNHGTFV